MIKDLSPDEYDAILRSDLGYFAERCFCELNPQTELWTNWHIEVIAAERTGRRGRALELDPGYVDTAIRRWQALTGGKARHAESGRSFDDLAAEAEAANAR